MTTHPLFQRAPFGAIPRRVHAFPFLPHPFPRPFNSAPLAAIYFTTNYLCFYLSHWTIKENERLLTKQVSVALARHCTKDDFQWYRRPTSWFSFWRNCWPSVIFNPAKCQKCWLQDIAIQQRRRTALSISENDFCQPYRFVFPLPHPTCNDANLSLAKGERSDDVTWLRSESETENDEENLIWQQWLSATRFFIRT